MIILVDHFMTAGHKLKQHLHSIFSKMNNTSDLATPSELISHQRFLSATIRNIKLEAAWRQKDSNKKLQNLKIKRRTRSPVDQQDRYSHEAFNVCLADTFSQDDLVFLPLPEPPTSYDAHLSPPQASTSTSTSTTP